MRLFMDFLPVIVWAVLAGALVVMMLLTSWVLRPHTLQNSEKTATYECGEEPIGPARISYPYNYIVYTVLFVVVDVLTAFLWIFASGSWSIRGSTVIVGQVIIFTLIIMVGIWYAVSRIPETILDGSETLAIYQDAKAKELEKEVSH
jgi:NADH:ubiquinone oxidoreductase subunit 3 (subunit A)